MTTRITPLPGALEERFRSPSVSVIDQRPVSSLSRDEWVAVVDKYLRDVYGMGRGHPLCAEVTEDHWTGWYTDPDRPTTRILEAGSVVAAMALCGRLLPLIAGRGDVWAAWAAETMRSRGGFPEWARVENRRLIVVNLFGESGAPGVTEPEKSEALDKALKRPHIPMDFERPELLMPEGMSLPRVVLGSRLHSDDIPADLPVGTFGEFEPLTLQPEMVPSVFGASNRIAAAVDEYAMTGELPGGWGTHPEHAIRVSAVAAQLVESAPPTPEELAATKARIRGEGREIGAGFVVGSAAQRADHLSTINDTLATAPPGVAIPCPAVVKGELHNTRDVPAALGTVGDSPTPPKDAVPQDKLARIKAWHEAQQAARKAGK